MDSVNCDGSRDRVESAQGVALRNFLGDVKGEPLEAHYSVVQGEQFVALRMLKDSEGLDQFQWTREGSTNCFEAIMEAIRRGWYKSGRVRISVGEARGRPAIFFDDDGVGFAPGQMEGDLMSYGGSSKTTGRQENYGTGSKSAIVMQNVFGVEWLSWQNGTGCRCFTFRREDGMNVWGAVRDPDTGEVIRVFSADDSLMPDIVRETGHGTRLIIYGVPGEPLFSPDSTALKPGSDFLHAYLEGRYFRIPEGIDFRACANFRMDKKDQHPRVIRGFAYYLDNPENHELKGVVQLDGARVHWWVLNENVAGHSTNRSWLKNWPNGGQIAFLYRNEVFTHHRVRTGERGASVLSNFGVTSGADRVVLLVEPDPERSAMSHTRGEVVFDGKVLLWKNAVTMWGGAFADNMPEKLAAYIDSRKLHPFSDDVNQNIQQAMPERLCKYIENGAVHELDGTMFRIVVDRGTKGDRSPAKIQLVKSLNDQAVTKMRNMPDLPDPGDGKTHVIGMHIPLVQMDDSVDPASAVRFDGDPHSERPGMFHINEWYPYMQRMLSIATEHATEALGDYVACPDEYVRKYAVELAGLHLVDIYMMERLAAIAQGVKDPTVVYDNLDEKTLTTSLRGHILEMEKMIHARIDDDGKRFRKGQVVRRKRTMQTDDRSRNLGGLKAVQDTDNRTTSGRRRASKKETK